MRITKKVFLDLALYMMGFGIGVGLIFPLFVLAVGIPRSYVLTPTFITFCIMAGLLVGAVNIILAKTVVGKRLRFLAARMDHVGKKLSSGLSSAELAECTQEECLIPVDSEDEIGESARAFNDLVKTLSTSMMNEHAVKQFNELLSTQLEIDQLATKALTHILEFMDGGAGAILLERGGELEVISSMNISSPQSLLENDSVWNVVVQKRGMTVKLAQDILIESPLVQFKPIETRIDPLLYKGLPVGIILIASGKVFDNETHYGYEMFLRTLALALRNATTYEQLQKLAANDPLTGLFNRRFGMTRLNEEYTRAIRSKLPLGIIMFDIDHFKPINDTYGHVVGDKMLVNIARISRMAVREGDFIIRYGGDEFLVILPGASAEDTHFVAERLRHMVEDSTVSHNQQVLRLTISVGLTSFPENDSEDEMALVRNADEALYETKEAGRNRVTIFAPKSAATIT
jgi:diguanylate cyclase (GGDEF)-like protein